MYDRLDDMPVFDRHPDKISATHYNHVKLALKRLGDEIRLTIPKLQGLDLILQNNAWIIVDRSLEAMEMLLGEELAEMLPDELSDVIEFRNNDD